MPTQGVVDRHRVGKALVASARTHAQQVGERLQQNLAAVLEDGETLPDLTHLQLLFARLLERRLDALLVVGRQERAELSEHRGPRKLRSEAAAEAREYLDRLRRAFRGAFGRACGPSLLGLTGRVPREPVSLCVVATEALDRLRTLLAVGPPQPRPGIHLKLELVVETLQAKVESLDQTIQQVKRDELEAEATRILKSQAVEGFDAAARALQETLEGWCHLAGLPEIARQLGHSPRTSDPRQRPSKGA
jgi:hypothetical protein